VFPYRRTPEREALYWFTEPFFIAKVRLFLRANDPWEPGDVAALQGRLGCTLHSAQAPARLQREVNAGRLTLQTVSQLDACFRMLQLRRVDFVIAGQNTGWDAQHRLAAEGLRLRAAALVVAEEPVHLALSRRLPGSAARVERFNRALRRLRAQGTLQRLEAESVPQPGEPGGRAPVLKPPAGR
jgi:polar amino acid transport system substrate-binding protein